MKLYAKNLLFRGDTPKDQTYDCCIHGTVVFQIGDALLSDDTEWCISASAYRFLKTLYSDHLIGAEDFLIPCCGHFMDPSEDKCSVNIIGCSNGIDFNIIHEGKRIIIITEKNEKYTLSFDEYKHAVLNFAKQIMDFYFANPPRAFYEDFQKEGFSAFITEWYTLYNTFEKKTLSFEDYDTYSENQILDINKKGITLKNFRFISFEECEQNSTNIIGEKDIETLSYTFYTPPKPIMIKFLEKNKILEFFSKENALSRFKKFEHTISNFGYQIKKPGK